MQKYNRMFILSIALVLLSAATLRASAWLSTGATPLASAFLQTEQAIANPTIHEDVADRAYTVMQSKRVEVQMTLPASASSEGRFQITLSSTLPITSWLSPITFSLQEGATARPNLLSSPSQQGVGRVIVTGTIRASAQKWLVTVGNLPTEPSLRVQVSMTTQVGKITGVTIDPVVRMTQTTIVTAPLPSAVSLKGYGAVKKLPRSSKLPCAELTMQWRPAPGASANTPSISTVVTNSVGTIERRCLAEGVVSLINTLPSGRYTYTLQAASGGFTNQAQAVLEVHNPPTPTPTHTPTDIPTDTPTPPTCPTGQVGGPSGCATVTPTPTNPPPTLRAPVPCQLTATQDTVRVLDIIYPSPGTALQLKKSYLFIVRGEFQLVTRDQAFFELSAYGFKDDNGLGQFGGAQVPVSRGCQIRDIQVDAFIQDFGQVNRIHLNLLLRVDDHTLLTNVPFFGDFLVLR